MGQLHGFSKTKKAYIVSPVKMETYLEKTIDLYREVVAFFLDVIQKHQEVIESNSWLKDIEQLTIQNKNNLQPLHCLKQQFGKYPSGWRRAAIAEAYGQASSWKTRYDKWKEKKQKQEGKNIVRIQQGKNPVVFKEHPPVYPEKCTTWLSYYATEYEWVDAQHILLKVFTGSTYIKVKFALACPVQPTEKYQMGSPTLLYKGTGWTLQVPMVLPRKEAGLVKLQDRLNIPNFKMCVVDLGINHHAVLTIQDKEGRVYATKFISGKKDNHLRKLYLERVVNLQKKTGTLAKSERFAADLWDKISNFNDNVAHII